MIVTAILTVKAVKTVKTIKSVALLDVFINVFEIYFLKHFTNFEETFVIFFISNIDIA
jgi:hypothetical protein